MRVALLMLVAYLGRRNTRLPPLRSQHGDYEAEKQLQLEGERELQEMLARETLPLRPAEPSRPSSERDLYYRRARLLQEELLLARRALEGLAQQTGLLESEVDVLEEALEQAEARSLELEGMLRDAEDRIGWWKKRVLRLQQQLKRERSGAAADRDGGPEAQRYIAQLEEALEWREREARLRASDRKRAAGLLGAQGDRIRRLEAEIARRDADLERWRAIDARRRRAALAAAAGAAGPGGAAAAEWASALRALDWLDG